MYQGQGHIPKVFRKTIVQNGAFHCKFFNSFLNTNWSCFIIFKIDIPIFLIIYPWELKIYWISEKWRSWREVLTIFNWSGWEIRCSLKLSTWGVRYLEYMMGLSYLGSVITKKRHERCTLWNGWKYIIVTNRNVQRLITAHININQYSA